MTIDRPFIGIGSGKESTEVFRFTHDGNTLFKGKDITKFFSKIVCSEEFEKLVKKFESEGEEDER